MKCIRGVELLFVVTICLSLPFDDEETFLTLLIAAVETAAVLVAAIETGVVLVVAVETAVELAPAIISLYEVH
jgi:hypothetical protein